MPKRSNILDDPAYAGCPATLLPNLKDARIDGDHLQLFELLGYGAWSAVYKAKPIKMESRYNSDQFYAVKCMIPRRLSPWLRSAIFQESRLQKRCAADSSSILKVVNVINEDETTGLLYIVTEYCEGGDLSEFIEEQKNEKNPKSERRIRKIFGEILDAVETCHKKGIYHRDLKPANIMLKKRGKKAVLGDFGLATEHKTSREYGVGSEPYMAPELFAKTLKPVSASRTDVWALGIILVNLITGHHPWVKATFKDRAFEHYEHGTRDLSPYLLKDVSPEVNRILKRVFERDPQKRMSLRELRYWISRVRSFTREPQPDLDLGCDFTPSQRARLMMQRAGRPGINDEVPGFSFDSDSDSDELDSNGPDTPETRAVDDVGIAGAVEIPELDTLPFLDLGTASPQKGERGGFRIVRVTTKEQIESNRRRLRQVSAYFAAKEKYPLL